MQLNLIFQTFRPSFLVLTPVCVFLGLSTSLEGQSINYFMVLLVLVGAVAAHISVNTLNEYFDFRSGLDLKTKRTRFSGGSGTLPGHPGIAGQVLMAGLMSLSVTVLIGMYFILELGPGIVPVGLVGVLLVITYTQWLNRSPFLCLVAPGLGFGILMVGGTHVVLTGGYSPFSWLVSLVPFFLINNLLLLNQYPDMEADASVGRKTFPIAFGLRKSHFMYAFSMVAAYSLIFLFIVKGYISSLGIIALLPMTLAVYALVGATRYASEIGEAPRYMMANVAAAILTPLLLGVSIIYG